MSTPIFAPYSQSYAQREPYITAAEYIASPTGVEVSDLVPNGTTQQNADALAQTIARASSWADEKCRQILAATMEVQAGRYKVLKGAIRIPVDQSPIVAVYGASFGPDPSILQALTSFAGMEIARKVVTFPSQLWQAVTSPFFSGTYPSLMGGGYNDGSLYCTLQYVAGYSNAVLTAQATIGGNTLTLTNVLGVAPGMTLTIYDPGQSEAVTVLSTSGNTVTIVGTLQYTHAVGVNVSALPAAIKQAVVLLTNVLIKARAAQAIVFSSYSGTPADVQATTKQSPTEEGLADEMLRPFRRVF